MVGKGEGGLTFISNKKAKWYTQDDQRNEECTSIHLKCRLLRGRRKRQARVRRRRIKDLGLRGFLPCLCVPDSLREDGNVLNNHHKQDTDMRISLLYYILSAQTFRTTQRTGEEEIEWIVGSFLSLRYRHEQFPKILLHVRLSPSYHHYPCRPTRTEQQTLVGGTLECGASSSLLSKRTTPPTLATKRETLISGVEERSLFRGRGATLKVH